MEDFVLAERDKEIVKLKNELNAARRFECERLGEVWLRAWCATASSSNAMRRTSAVGWADDCLAEYVRRFAGVCGAVPQAAKTKLDLAAAKEVPTSTN
jgi:hypothetical protein